MARILGIVGSPRKDGLTHQLVRKALDGAASQGAETDVRFLADLTIHPCESCGRNCWAGDKCKFDDDAPLLQEEIKEADGIILGAPVYYLDVNGLTKNFMDRMRLSGAVNGKRALGIAIAGGTGKGLILALKTLYHFFFCVGLRGLSPTPVSRFNFDSGLRAAFNNGAALAKPPVEPIPFHNVGERISWTLQLPFMGHDIADENLYLAKVVTESCRKTEKNANLLQEAQAALVRAAQLIEHRKKRDAIEHIMAAYEAGTKAWRIGRES